MMETHRFRNDTQTRKRLMVPDSFAHPAKGHLGLWQTMIERYSQPGDLVLDPMAGIGTTLVAALMGRNVICVELEQHFVEPMCQSWEKMRTMPMLGHEMGHAVILRGDARCLPLPDASVEAAITSPPYSDERQGGGLATREYQERSLADGTAASGIPGRNNTRIDKWGYTRPVDAIISSPPYEGTGLQDLNASPLNGPIGHNSRKADNRKGKPESSLHLGAHGYTRPVDSIITSPPYEGSAAEGPSGIDWTKQADGRKKQEPHGVGSHPWGYTRPVDAIVTSPPFQDQTILHDMRFTPPHHTQRNEEVYSRYTRPVDAIGGNVGNERGPQYWLSMSRIYAECWRVLKPSGIMALVLKGYTRDGLYVNLPAQTEALLLEAGWQKHDHWRRELWSLSFWRILQKRRDPAAFDERLKFEEVLAFRKGAA